MELNLSFGGFYHSNHSEIVDSIIESHFDDDTTNKDEFYDSIDFQKTYKDYCKYYIRYFFDYIQDVEGIKLTIKEKNVDMWTPREYNFSTDVIVLKDVSNSTVKNLTTLFNRYLESEDLLLGEDKEFRDFIRDKTTSRSGYIPFYDYEEIVDKRNLEVSLEFILEFLAKQFNDEVDDIYYKMTENLNLSFIK